MLSEKDNAGPDGNAMHAMGTDAEGEEDAHQSSGDRVELSASGHVQCSICSSTFRRPEHLKRHLRSHTKEKPFECAQCGRHFSRTDTLHRHELSHHTAGSEGGKDRMHRITVKTFRACSSCATARVRCSGGIPCGRCDTRSLECQYPTERRSKARVRNGTSRGRCGVETQEHELQTPGLSSPQFNGSHTESTGSYQRTQFPANGTDDSQPSPKTSTNAFPNAADDRSKITPSDGRGPIEGASNPPLCLSSSNPTSSSARLPLGVYPNGDCQQPYGEIMNTNVPKLYSVAPTARLGPEMRELQPGMTGSGVDIDMDMTTNPEMALEFDPSFLDQSILSTINWLPNEFFVGTSSDHAQASRVPSLYSQPTASNPYAARMTWHPPMINTGQLSPSIAENQTPSGQMSLGPDMGSPRRYSHVVSESSPHSESVDSGKRSADYYVDGGGARLPKYRKKQTPWSTSSTDAVAVAGQSLCEDSMRRFAFRTVHDIHVENISEEVARFVRPIEATTYDQIYRNFLVLCRSDNPFFEMFDSETFPPAEDCSRYLACYFDSFQTVYPILHLPTFDPNQCHWLLTLALVAVGCHSSAICEADQCTAAFHEMIRRAICVEKEKLHAGQISLELMQAMLLNCIGLIHSGSERAKLAAMNIFKGLVTFMNRDKLLASSSTTRNKSHGTSEESLWMEWVQDEVGKRTGYCIWLLDCTLAYYFDDRPLLSLDDGQAALPAHEKLWQASSAESWKQLWDKSDANESLFDAVHILYIEKRLVSGIGEFSHILLIHALYHRMWEVGDYFRRPLSFWNPTAKKQSRETVIPTGSVWLPGIPSYSKWRNSACDCLDILHWTANSTIAKAAGLEHPTVLHLHAARLVLLAPFREIRSLATSLATDQLRWSKRHQAIEWQYIWRWVKHDQYKARLSIIHAGVTLWHVRRYSTNAFHEPVAAFLAVLTLWAYGACHAHTSQESSPHPQTSRAEALQEPNFVHLDRPCDDELVQLFVREGDSMRGNVTGVGDICAPEGPERILRVGCETLSSLTAWGISKRFIAILTRLADLVARHPDVEPSRNGTM